MLIYTIGKVLIHLQVQCLPLSGLLPIFLFKTLLSDKAIFVSFKHFTAKGDKEFTEGSIATINVKQRSNILTCYLTTVLLNLILSK